MPGNGYGGDVDPALDRREVGCMRARSRLLIVLVMLAAGIAWLAGVYLLVAWLG